MRQAQSKKSNETVTTPANIISSTPFACHFDAETILTRDGELMQTICVRGYEYEVYENGTRHSLRDDVRRAFAELCLKAELSVSIHIVRRQANLSLPGNFPKGFAEELDEKWGHKNQWSHGFVNDLYITILHEGGVFPLWNLMQISRSLVFRAEKYSQRKSLEKAKKTLQETTDAFLERLVRYHPKKLGTIERDDIALSEPLGFFYYLSNIRKNVEPVPMPVSDMADVLLPEFADFGFNTIQIQSQGAMRHASIFSVKQYSEVLPSSIDAFLQYPGEFVVTHQIMLGAPKKFLKDTEYKKYITELGDDRDFARLSGVDDILASNQGSPMDYAIQQTTIMVMADSPGQLEGIVHDMMKKLGEAGIAVVREDIMMEDMFFSQLPGNFELLRRKDPISIRRIAGYATLYDFPAGKRAGNQWGSAITMLPSAKRYPYFFSFHEGQNGHTMIAGPYGSGKTVLLHFLMAQAMRVKPRLFLLDNLRSGEPLIRALGGQYLRFTRDKGLKLPKLNPLMLPDNPANRAFIEEWLLLLFYDLDGNLQGGEGVKSYINSMVTWVMTQPPENRRLSAMLRHAKDLPPQLKEYFEQWVGQGRYGHLFDHDADEWPENTPILGIDITEMVQDRRPQWAVLAYIMHRYIQSLTSEPSLCVMDEAWVLMDNPVFSGKLSLWLDMMRQRNTAAVLATEHIEDITQGEITPLVVLKTATRIFFPDPNATEAYQTQLGLSQEEYKAFAATEKERRQFFVKHGAESVVLELQLPENRGMIEVLKGSPNMVTRMENVIAQAGEKPEQWLPLFYQQVVGGNAT